MIFLMLAIETSNMWKIRSRDLGSVLLQTLPEATSPCCTWSIQIPVLGIRQCRQGAQRSLDRSRANNLQCCVATFNPKSRNGEKEGQLPMDTGPGRVQAGEAPPVRVEYISSYSLQVASIGSRGAQALGDALAVNRTLEILE